MLFKCKWTGKEITASKVRSTRAIFKLPDGRTRQIFFPRDPSVWDDKLIEAAFIERIPPPAPVKAARKRKVKK